MTAFITLVVVRHALTQNSPLILKEVNIIPNFLKKETYSKPNYRPVSVVSYVSKIFEQCKFCQINEYMDAFLSRHQCGFRNGYGAQQCLLAMYKETKSAVGNEKNFWKITNRLV